MAIVVRTRAITDDVILTGLSCGHQYALEGPLTRWPIGHEFECFTCAHPEMPEPRVSAVSGNQENTHTYTLFFSCGHFCQTEYHHRLTFTTVSQLLNTQQFCLQCAQQRHQA